MSTSDLLADLDTLSALADLKPVGIEEVGEWTIPSYERSWFGDQVSEACEAVLRWTMGWPGGVPVALISMAPRHGKTTRMGQILPALAHGLDPDMPIMGTAYATRLAKQSLRAAKNIIEHPRFRERFNVRVGSVEAIGATRGKSKLIREVSDQVMYRTLDAFGRRRAGYYFTQGINASQTGFGFRLGAIDDPVRNLTDALSAAMTQRVRDWFDATWDTRREGPQAGMVLGCTRWTNNDLYSYVREKMVKAGVPFIERRFPCIQDDSIPEPYDPRKPGESLRFRGRTDAWYEEVKAKLYATGMEHIWHAMWQARDSVPGGGQFRSSWWGYYDPTQLPSIAMEAAFIVVDGNLVAGGKSNAAIEAYFASGPYLYKVDEEVGSWEYAEFRRRLIGFIQRWPECRPVVIERAANGIAVASDLESMGFTGVELWSRDLHLMKEARAMLSQPDIAAGWTKLPTAAFGSVTSYWVEAHKREWEGFPRQKPNDRVDAGCMARRWWRMKAAAAGAPWTRLVLAPGLQEAIHGLN